MKRKISSALAILFAFLVLFTMNPVYAASNQGITLSKAKKIALHKTGGGTVVKCEPDYENRTKVYEIAIEKGKTEYEMDVIVSTGSIRHFEKDIDD